MTELAVVGGRVLDPGQGIDETASVLISDGVITSIEEETEGVRRPQPRGPAGGWPERMGRGGVASTALRSDRVFPDFTFGTHLCDVEVDLDTGQVTVLRYVAAHDVGRAINPLSVEGQVSGAVVQGLGMALLEEVVLDEGINLTAGFFQYLVPTATDVPDIEVIILESGEGMGPFGARGIGEPPIGPPLAAVANAIRDAVGTRPTTLPVTPERVLACLRSSPRRT